MNDQPQIKTGCGPIMVAVIAVFSLTIGFLAGAGALYGVLYANSDALIRLNLAESADSPSIAQTQEPIPAAAPSEVYALAYPILETVQIQGTLDEQAVRNRLTRDRFTLQECYQQDLIDRPETRGEMSLQFTVAGSNGKVVAAVSRENYTGSEALSLCVLAEIRDWSFPAPETDQVSVVRFDMLFLPFRAEG